jgi:hypothetical protein
VPEQARRNVVSREVGRHAVIVLGLTATMGCAGGPALQRSVQAVPVRGVAGVAPHITIGEDTSEAVVAEDPIPANAIRLCAEGPLLERATGSLRALDRTVGALDDAADPKSAKAELDRILDSPCFALARIDLGFSELAFDSGLAMKTWWSEGGATWLRRYTELDNRFLTVAGAPRRSLLLDRRAGHPLTPLLCRAKDGGCGGETAGWARRLTADLERRRPAERADWEACLETAKAEAPVHRYATYFDCMTADVVVQDAPPLGRFKAPRDGVFVTESATGQGCTELRVYALDTGARYAAEDCGQGVSISAGRVPLAALREAVWAILLTAARESGVRQTLTFSVPGGIAFVRPPESVLELSLPGISTTSGQQLRSWSWMRVDRGKLVGQVSGLLRTPDPTSDMAEHASELLAVADDGTTGGCAPGGLPAQAIRWDWPGPSIEDGVSVELDGPESAALRAALAMHPRAPACPAAP